VHDWFKVEGGAENVVTSLLNIYPEADFFSVVDFFTDAQRKKILGGKKATYTFIQRLPFAKKYFQHYLFLFPLAIERLDLRKYDLVISSSHAVAKGVLTGPDQLHICYSHTPMRYAWDMYFAYREEHHIKGIKEKILSYVLHKIRIWDVISSNRVDYFIANSSFVKQRISKYYRRDAKIIYPPVSANRYSLWEEKENYYFTASRLVPYKKIKMIVEAFVESGKPLVVAGSGSELKEIMGIATDNITILGYVKDERMVELMKKAKAFVFAAYEDFGIIPVEAMMCGTPVIAYGKGGIKNTMIDNVTGVLYHEQSVESLNVAINQFETMTFDYTTISNHASQFSTEHFEKEIKAFVNEKWEAFIKE
jgi:glycosyltransferase involved in cell wall biosynthesis